MRRLILSICVLSIAPLVLGGCGEGEVPPPPPRGNQVNLLVTTEGTIRLKREGWNDYVPVTFGTVVRSTDLIEVDGSGTTVTLDGAHVLIGSGAVSLLGNTQNQFVFSNAGSGDVTVDILVGRDATP